MRCRSATFDPARGSAWAYLASGILPEDLRSVRTEYAPPGAPKRQRKPGARKTPPPSVALDDVPELRAVGYGSPKPWRLPAMLT